MASARRRRWRSSSPTPIPTTPRPPTRSPPGSGCRRSGSPRARSSTPPRPSPTVTSSASGPSALTVLHTPGHTADHICLVSEGIVFTGDHVIGGTTVVIEDAAAYLDSLERVLRIGPRHLCPGHGEEMPEAVAAVEAVIAHRRRREDEIIAAVSGGATSVPRHRGRRLPRRPRGPPPRRRPPGVGAGTQAGRRGPARRISPARVGGTGSPGRRSQRVTPSTRGVVRQAVASPKSPCRRRLERSALRLRFDPAARDLPRLPPGRPGRAPNTRIPKRDEGMKRIIVVLVATASTILPAYAAVGAEEITPADIAAAEARRSAVGAELAEATAAYDEAVSTERRAQQRGQAGVRRARHRRADPANEP